MARTSPPNRSEITDSSPSTDAALLLRNEDDATHALDVRIADGDGVPTEERHTVASDGQCAVPADADGPLSVDLRADHGASASLVVDLQCSPTPEFVVRRETIMVAGLY